MKFSVQVEELALSERMKRRQGKLKLEAILWWEIRKLFLVVFTFLV